MSPSIHRDKPSTGKHPHEDLDPADAREDFSDATQPEDELIEELEHSQRREAGLSDDSPPGHGPDKDDLDLEDLIHEDGARSPLEDARDLRANYAQDEDAGDPAEELEPAEQAHSAREKPGGRS
ncbi:hypothetical protein [Pseudomonas paeninsulae]|uniref:hypothetical protein n=1 Tax=Pseudomonas paeninsulae TaxID=3110772 RepID=UPI002D780F42|nr:hypothetical protein [Pseudomonas sp. IT1137]